MPRTFRLARLVVPALFVTGAALGCGSKSTAAPGNGGSVADDGGVADPPASDGGAAAEAGGFTPAYTPDVGQIVRHGGPLLTSPKIVTVTWNADPNQAELEAFDDALGASSYWSTVVGEYGVGAATGGAHVHVTTAPPAMQDNADLETWILDQIQGAPGTGWPVADASNVYAVYVPVGMILLSVGSYHGEMAIGNNPHVPFVVIDQNEKEGSSSLDAATRNGSHEIAETVTNPHNFTDVALTDFDPPHIAWQMMATDAEIGDVCETNSDANFKGGAELPFLLQRLWSNKAAAAGHNPCVPAEAEPFYNVTPLDLETVSVFVNNAAAAQSGLGYRIAIGEKKSIKVGFFSDAPVSGPWTITAMEGNWFSPASNHRLTISVDQGSGKNGDTGTITVAANTQSSGLGNAVLMTITSQAPGLAPHSVPVLIGTY